jgi:hypothetical protein
VAIGGLAVTSRGFSTARSRGQFRPALIARVLISAAAAILLPISFLTSQAAYASSVSFTWTPSPASNGCATVVSVDSNYTVTTEITLSGDGPCYDGASFDPGTLSIALIFVQGVDSCTTTGVPDIEFSALLQNTTSPQTVTAVAPGPGTYSMCELIDGEGLYPQIGVLVIGTAAGIYAALGDSYSAGVGSGGATLNSTCLTNVNAYPEVWLESHLQDQIHFAACSGSSSASIDANQLTAITSGTTLITLTAGGDDNNVFGTNMFLTTVVACSIPGRVGDRLCALAENADLVSIAGPVHSSLNGLYRDIVTKAASVGAASARFIVFDYPDFFQERGTCGLSDVVEQTDINTVIDALDATIAKLAVADGATFVDVRRSFASHELCSKAPWLNGISVSDPVTSFHPNQAGQAQGYEAALTAITG